ncbi:MAG: invasion associated locus B family protein [Rhodocyclaceae bacterium]|nr:invasion associated locus B family protein [Rhodocyclaceae bacterium]
MPAIFRSVLLVLGVAALPAAVLAESVPSGQSAVYGSWSVECPAKSGQCAALQKVATDPEGKQVVLGVIIETVAGKAIPQLTFRLPTTAYRQAGAGMKVDDHEPLRAPISACDDKVCEVRAWLSDSLRETLTTGKLLRFAYFVDPERQITLPVSLAGLDQALAHMDKARSKAGN